jgi:hypothetical protein
VDWVALEAIGTTVAAFAAVAAIGWGVWEFRRRNIEDLDERVAELLGVTLTYELQKPRPSHARDGVGTFTYRFTVHNPGRLPITEVSAWMTYPGLVRRVHYDGTVDEASSTYEMNVASVAGHGQHTWRRELQVPVELWSEMRKTTARISFLAPDVGPYETTWPRVRTYPSKRLQERLQQSRPAVEAETSDIAGSSAQGASEHP